MPNEREPRRGEIRINAGAAPLSRQLGPQGDLEDAEVPFAPQTWLDTEAGPDNPTRGLD